MTFDPAQIERCAAKAQKWFASNKQRAGDSPLFALEMEPAMWLCERLLGHADPRSGVRSRQLVLVDDDREVFLTAIRTGHLPTSAVIDRLETKLAYGAADCSSEATLCELLYGLGTALLRDNKLCLGMRSLRAAGYVDQLTDRRCQDVISFLLSRQLADGGFVSLSALKLDARGDPGAVVVQATVARHALWTLAELVDSDFRLARARAPW